MLECAYVETKSVTASLPTGHVHVLAASPWACRVPVACSPTQLPTSLCHQYNGTLRP